MRGKWYSAEAQAASRRQRVHVTSVALARRGAMAGRAAAAATRRKRIREAATRLREAFRGAFPDPANPTEQDFLDGSHYFDTPVSYWFPGSTVQNHEAHRFLAYDDPPEGLEVPGSDEWCDKQEEVACTA